MTYYRLQMADANASDGATFEDEETAEKIRDIFNKRYASEYEVVEVEDPSPANRMQAGTIKALELH